MTEPAIEVPVVGGDDNVWGPTVNEALLDLDSYVKARIPKTVAQRKGDLLAATDAGTVVAMPVGADGQVLHADAATATWLRWLSVPAPTIGDIANRPAPAIGATYIDAATGQRWEGIRASGVDFWAPPPGQTVFYGQGQVQTSVANNPATPVPLGLPEVATQLWPAMLSGTRVSPKVPGWYLTSGGVAYLANSTGMRAAWLLRSGGQLYPTHGQMPAVPAPGLTSVPTRTVAIYLNGTTDYVEIAAYHNAGVALNAVYQSLSLVYAGQ